MKRMERISTNSSERTSSNSSTLSAPIHSGWLYKSGEDFISIYKKRYFRLYAEEKQLIYFQSDKDGLEKQLGVIDLSCISEPVRISSSIIQPSQSGLKKYQNFDIITSNRTWHLRAESSGESLTEWVKVINSFVQSENQSNFERKKQALMSEKSLFFKQKRKELNQPIKAVALFDFDTTEDSELGFKKGDEILILSRLEGSDWCKGKLDAKTGLFPSNFVEFKSEELEKETEAIENEWNQYFQEKLKQFEMEESLNPESNEKGFVDILSDFDSIVSKIENGIQICKELVEFMKKKASMEEEYGKKLNGLVKNLPYGKLETKKDLGISKEYSSLKGVISELFQLEDYMGEAHQQLASQLQKSALRLEDWIKNNMAEKKRLVQEGMKLFHSLQDSKANLMKIKETREKSLKEQELARDKVEKSEKLEKMDKKSHLKYANLVDKNIGLETSYQNSVQKFNSDVVKMKQLVSSLETWEKDRWKFTLNILIGFKSMLSSIPTSFEDSLKAIDRKVLLTSFSSDVNLFIQSLPMMDPKSLLTEIDLNEN